MRIAESVSHRIFERTLRPLVFRRARLFERHHTLQALLDVGRCEAINSSFYGEGLTHVWNAWASDLSRHRERSKTFCHFALSELQRTASFLVDSPPKKGRVHPLKSLASDQAGIPAELKHINKRRKRNQQGLPQ